MDNFQIVGDSSWSTGESRSYLAQRIILLITAVCFIALYQWIYINFLSVNFDSYGFEYYKSAAPYLPLSWILSLLPTLWMPIRLTRPSQLLCWMIYLTVYVPSMFIPLLASLDPPADTCRLMLILFLGFSIISATYRLPLVPLKFARVSKEQFWRGFWVLWV